MFPKPKSFPESFNAYEDGKHRRYGLLFTVNGGAFVIAKLLAGQHATVVLGGLSLWQLSLGMFLFTAVMVVDIYFFGKNMRSTYLPGAFGTPGKTVLILLGLLIGAGWLLIGREDLSMTMAGHDAETLMQLNMQIGEAESRGDRDGLDGVIASRLAFQRADGVTVDDRAEFLSKIKAGDSRQTRIESIDIIGDRAIVKCVVTLKSAGADKSYHNLRLFVRQAGQWKLLGWANESL